jgi:hypothetical protein
MIEAQLERSEIARGTSRLLFDAVEQVTHIVEGMHANIAAASPPLGKGTSGRTRGIPGLVYGSTRLVNGVSRSILDRALGFLPGQQTPSSVAQPQADAARGALNGVVGDHLLATANPLAIPLRLRRNGQPLRLESGALAAAIPEANGKILVAVHGLCMNDRQWKRNDHDHAAALARDRGYTLVYLHYNSGRHISENGRDLAVLLERLVDAWPVPVSELSVLTHSMGGLITRSACHYASRNASRNASPNSAKAGAASGTGWLAVLRRIVFLGTPHHGAPLERGGHSVVTALGISPYTAPLARLGWLRSAGITDLRYGNLLDEDWQPHDRFASTGDLRRSVSLPEGVECYALAATTGKLRGDLNDRLIGDGLVPVASALGRHRDEEKSLAIPESHRSVCYGTNHMDLLSDPEVYAQVRDWHR